MATTGIGFETHARCLTQWLTFLSLIVSVSAIR